MANTTAHFEGTARPVENLYERNIRQRRGWYVAQGILFILAGVLAFFVPAAVVWGVEIFLAALLIASGGYQTYQGFTDRSGWMVASGVLSLIVGGLLIFMPAAGIIAVATLIAVFLLIEGVMEIIWSLQIRFSRGWGLLLVSGILSIVLSALLLMGWPGQTVILAGLFLGINFIFYGVALLALVASVGKQSST